MKNNTSYLDDIQAERGRRTAFESKSIALVHDAAEAEKALRSKRSALVFWMWLAVALATYGAQLTLQLSGLSIGMAIGVALLVHLTGCFGAEYATLGALRGQRGTLIGGVTMLLFYLAAIAILFALRCGFLSEDGGGMAGLAVASAILAIEVLSSILGGFSAKSKHDLEIGMDHSLYFRRCARDIHATAPDEQELTWSDHEDKLDYELQQLQVANDGSRPNELARIASEYRLIRLQEAHPGQRFATLNRRRSVSNRDLGTVLNGKSDQYQEAQK